MREHMIPSDLFELLKLERERWAEVDASIPAWHPRNEGEDPPAEEHVDTPQGTDEQTNEWEQRYKDLQADYTRKSQDLARYEKDPDFKREHFQKLASELGYSIEEPDPDEGHEEDEYEFVDPVARKQLEELQSRLAESEQNRELAEMDRSVKAQFKRLGIDDDQDQELLLLLATRPGAPPNADGMPDIEAARASLTKRDEAAQKRWAQTKRAPRIAGGGQTGTQVPDLDNEQDRVAWMAQQWAASAD
jgi:hypothetical protein